MRTWGWILFAFTFGGIVGSSLTFRYMFKVSDGWKNLYYDLKDKVEAGEGGE